jgi:hypothetical protein
MIDLLSSGLRIGPKQSNKVTGAIDPSIGGNFVKDVVEGARDQAVEKVIRSGSIQPW